MVPPFVLCVEDEVSLVVVEKIHGKGGLSGLAAPDGGGIDGSLQSRYPREIYDEQVIFFRSWMYFVDEISAENVDLQRSF